MHRSTILIAVLLSACTPDSAIPNDPGAYLTKVSDTVAQIRLVTSDRQHITIQGAFKNDTAIPPWVARMAPSSVNGLYTVTTQNCGAFHFIEAKGGGLICRECEIININRGAYAKCELSKHKIPLTWSSIGL